MTVRSMFLLPVALFALFVVADSARAQDATPINALPYTITQPGTYYLTSDQYTSFTTGAAITIQSDNVVLDLGNHAIDNFSVAAATAVAVLMPADQMNVTVRGGLIRGFDAGVKLGVKNSRILLVENVRLEHCLRSGIVINGHDSTVRNNFIAGTGGSVPFENGNVTAIFLIGDGLRVLDNDISNTVGPEGTGSIYGILVNSSVGASSDVLIQGNRITNPQPRPSSYGISVVNSTTALVIGNRISATVFGVSFGNGAQGKYRDNLTFNVTTPFTGGTNGGGNS